VDYTGKAFRATRRDCPGPALAKQCPPLRQGGAGVEGELFSLGNQAVLGEGDEAFILNNIDDISRAVYREIAEVSLNRCEKEAVFC